jgi:hypothetical protein
MADDRVHGQPDDERGYEPPAVESLGSAEELAKDNEGSPTDTVTDAG